MATKASNIDLEKKHFDSFRHCLPGIENCCEKTIDHLLELGIIQVSTAYEHALANVHNVKVVSEDERDLDNGADCKLTTVRTHGNGKCYGAPIKSIATKTGPLWVQVYERKLDKYYFFNIPYEAYSQIPKTSNIEIPFEIDGTPRKEKSPMHRLPNFWDHEVKSFFPPKPVKSWFHLLKNQLFKDK